MIVFKKTFLTLTEQQQKNLLINLKLDTVKPTYSSSLMRFFNGEIVMKERWLGEVRHDKLIFKIRRVKRRFLGTNFSTTTISAKPGTSNGTVEIKFGLVWRDLFAFVGVTTFIGILVALNGVDAWDWLIGIAIFTLMILFNALDFRKTEEAFREYLEKVNIPPYGTIFA
jgi:hypothetical protein